jgi:predicted nucleic acid-binding protein
MASPLAHFQGAVIYLDTNVLVGFIDADSVYHAACAAFFQRAVDPDRPIQLITATLTLDEVILSYSKSWSPGSPTPLPKAVVSIYVTILMWSRHSWCGLIRSLKPYVIWLF